MPPILYPPDAGWPRHRVPILVASYDTHCLRLGYSFSRPPHGNLKLVIVVILFIKYALWSFIPAISTNYYKIHRFICICFNPSVLRPIQYKYLRHSLVLVFMVTTLKSIRRIVKLRKLSSLVIWSPFSSAQSKFVIPLGGLLPYTFQIAVYETVQFQYLLSFLGIK